MVGAGGLANIAHYPSLAAMPDVDLVGIAELNAERLQTTADKYGVAGRYGDYRELVAREKPDAVYVIMPPQHLHNIVVDLLELGVHVFVEKPPAITTYQTEALAWYASRNDRLTMVGFNRRYIKMLRRCRAAITERGPLHQCLAGFHKFEAGPDNYGYGRGAVSHLTSDIIHAVDALRWMAGGEVVAVAADNRAVDMPFVNNHNAIVTFSTGCVAILTASRRSGRRDGHYFEMHGQGVSAFADDQWRATVYRDGADEGESIDAAEAGGGSETISTASLRLLRREPALHRRHQGRPPHRPDASATSFADAVKTMDLVDRISVAQSQMPPRASTPASPHVEPQPHKAPKGEGWGEGVPLGKPRLVWPGQLEARILAQRLADEHFRQRRLAHVSMHSICSPRSGWRHLIFRPVPGVMQRSPTWERVGVRGSP